MALHAPSGAALHEFFPTRGCEVDECTHSNRHETGQTAVEANYGIRGWPCSGSVIQQSRHACPQIGNGNAHAEPEPCTRCSSLNKPSNASDTASSFSRFEDATIVPPNQPQQHLLDKEQKLKASHGASRTNQIRLVCSLRLWIDVECLSTSCHINMYIFASRSRSSSGSGSGSSRPFRNLLNGSRSHTSFTVSIASAAPNISHHQTLPTLCLQQDISNKGDPYPRETYALLSPDQDPQASCFIRQLGGMHPLRMVPCLQACRSCTSTLHHKNFAVLSEESSGSMATDCPSAANHHIGRCALGGRVLFNQTLVIWLF